MDTRVVVPDDDSPATELAPTVLAPPTTLAWSEDSDEAPATRGWRPAFGWSAVVLAACAVVVLLVAGGATWLKSSPQSASEASTMSTVAAAPAVMSPLPRVWRPAQTWAPPTWVPTGSPKAPAAPDLGALFLARLDAASLSYASDTKTVIDGGMAVCTDFDHGWTYDRVVTVVRKNAPGLAPADAKVYVRVAVKTFCPNRDELLQ